EDGIRDRNVTGVQTCALPICVLLGPVWKKTGRSKPRVDDVGRDGSRCPGGRRRIGCTTSARVRLLLLVSHRERGRRGGLRPMVQIGRASCREGAWRRDRGRGV